MSKLSFSTNEYKIFQRFLSDSCGITLGDNKQYLITSRLGRLMDDYAVGSLSNLVDRLKNEPNGDLHNRIIDAMTTNETYWFRDTYPYEILKAHILPGIAEKKLERMRIWSAACSSGQEPYSISMAIEEYLDNHPGSLPDIEICATDISAPMLNIARGGLYDDIALSRGLTAGRKQRFFTAQDTMWRVNDNVRNRVKFYELNLINSFDKLGRFEIIFCRNVLIYFSNEMKRNILGKLADALRPEGYLVLGVSESPANYTEAFELVRCKEGLVYRLPKRR